MTCLGSYQSTWKQRFQVILIRTSPVVMCHRQLIVLFPAGGDGPHRSEVGASSLGYSLSVPAARRCKFTTGWFCFSLMFRTTWEVSVKLSQLVKIDPPGTITPSSRSRVTLRGSVQEHATEYWVLLAFLLSFHLGLSLPMGLCCFSQSSVFFQPLG